MVSVTLAPGARLCQAGSLKLARWKSFFSPPTLWPAAFEPLAITVRPKPLWSVTVDGIAVGTSNWNSVPPGRVVPLLLVRVSLGVIG